MTNPINYDLILKASINEDSKEIKNHINYLTPDIIKDFLDKVDQREDKYEIIEKYFTILVDLNAEYIVGLLININAPLLSDQWVRMKVSWVFKEIIKEKATNKLISFVLESNEKIWDEALLLLAYIGDPKAIDPLFSMYSSEKGYKKEKIAIALGRLRDPRSADPLISAYKNKGGKDCNSILIALRELKDKRAVEPLISTLDNNEVDNIELIVSTLNEIKDYRAVKPLISLIDRGIDYSKHGVTVSEVNKAILNIIKEDFDESLIKRSNNSMSKNLIRDILFQDNRYNNYIDNYFHSSPGNEIIREGSYVIARIGIGKTGESEYSPHGANSIIVIEAVVSKILPRDFFYKCSWNPDKYEKYGLIINHLDVSVLTEEQRNKIHEILYEDTDWFWFNATNEIKAILSGEISEKDKAKQIYNEGLKAYYDEKKNDFAKNLFEEAIEKNNEISGARNILGMIAIEEGDISNAIIMFKDELKYAASPMEHTSHLCLAEIYKNTGQNNKASVHDEKAKSIDNSTKLHPDLVKKITLAVDKYR